MILLNLAASDIRIEAPIPGKAAIGIEIPNKHNQTVHFRDLIESSTFEKFKSRLAFAVGKDIGGKTVTDLAKMPHLLIAGATGSGKSVCINTLIMSILYKASPEEVKLIMLILRWWNLVFIMVFRIFDSSRDRSEKSIWCAELGGSRDDEPL